MVEILILIFIILNALDTFVSIYALKLGMHDKNPVMALIVKHAGIMGFLLIKIALMIIVMVFAGSFHTDSLVILNILYTMIVANNTLKLYIARNL